MRTISAITHSTWFAALAAGAAMTIGIAVSTAIAASPEKQIAAETCTRADWGNLSLYGGITLSPEQIAAYETITTEMGEMLRPIYAAAPLKPVPDGALSMYLKEEGRSDKNTKSVIAAMDALAGKNLSVEEEIRILTASHGQFAVFENAQYPAYSPAQIAESNTLGAIWEARMLGILTAEQKPIFTANLAKLNEYNRCWSKDTAYSIQLFLGNFS